MPGIPSFNEAAPARARSEDTHAARSPGAECFNEAAPARARSAADIPSASLKICAASTRPRPRGRGVARASRHDNIPPLCFNEAAPARARSGGLSEAFLDYVSELQRGRARAGAE